MRRFSVIDTNLAGLKCIERVQLADQRGFLSRLFSADELVDAGWTGPVVQINHTYTRTTGTVRGMHFQDQPCTEKKLVSCLRGSVWDVAVDLRRSSCTFLKWHAQELSASNLQALLIPEGFAHGFQALTDDCELLYLHSNAYQPELENGVHPKDPMLSIKWPLPVIELSSKDSNRAWLDLEFKGLNL